MPRRRYRLDFPPEGDISPKFLNSLNTLFQQISEDVAAIQGYDGATPTFHNDFDLRKKRLCNVGRTRDEDDVPARRELREMSVYKASDGLITAKGKMHASAGIRVARATDGGDATPLTQTRELAAVTPPSWAADTLTQLTANTNDYQLGTLTVQCISTDASRNITGFVAAPNALKVIVNVGSNNAVLTHQDANSAAANRLTNQAAGSVTLTSTQAAIYWYDTTNATWRQLN